MVLRSREVNSSLMSWVACGGDTKLSTCGISGFPHLAESHGVFLVGTIGYYESRQEFFVHANADPELPLEDQLRGVEAGRKLRSYRLSRRGSGTVGNGREIFLCGVGRTGEACVGIADFIVVCIDAFLMQPTEAAGRVGRIRDAGSGGFTVNEAGAIGDLCFPVVAHAAVAVIRQPPSSENRSRGFAVEKGRQIVS